MEYKAIYKCRLCGAVYKSGATTGEAMAEAHMLEMSAGLCGTVPMAPRKIEMHRCGGKYTGSLGAADFCGWQAVPGYTDDRTESGLLED